MCKHITLLLPNRPGELYKVTKILGDHSLNIDGYHLTSEGSFGILQLLSNPHEKAFQVLKNEYKAYCTERDVIVVRLLNRPAESAKMLHLLYECGANLRNAYTVVGAPEESLSVLEVEPPEHMAFAKSLLLDNGYQLLDEVSKRDETTNNPAQ